MLDSTPIPTGKGRPPKFSDPASPAHLLHILETADCTLAEACRRCRWTPYQLRQVMLADPRIEFEFRLACARGPHKKRLSESWGRPEIVLEVAKEVHRLGQGESPRTWEQVLESIETRASGAAPDAGTLAAAMVEPVVIPDAREPAMEAF